ncbi:hypothetical protein MPSYJ_48510 [Mycolicibacterium psychrotolerans]|uniref:Uncharacterized protein n=1 Tax=Mycolicibacterium psychrotolerans TaxID=216929 RepID=A0A7I7MHT6_9MYCO|nr:hypothetical protein MPSYJ_48510 [Mycolicibacterium psychrotolerans]
MLLVDRDGDDHDDERHQQRTVKRFGKQEVDPACSEEQQQHRLTYDIPSFANDAATHRGRQLIRPVRGQSASRLLLRQSEIGRLYLYRHCRSPHEPIVTTIDYLPRDRPSPSRPCAPPTEQEPKVMVTGDGRTYPVR